MVLAVTSGLHAAMMSSVTYQADSAAYSITFTFDKQYECGQYANGDWWAKGPLTITGLTPAYITGRNGWQVNPTDQNNQPYDNRARMTFNAALMPSLPYQAQAGASIVKTASIATPYRGNWYIEFAAVLTVVAAIPTDSGRTVFRPPYMGTYKPNFSINDLQTQLLPSLAPTLNAITQAEAEKRTRVMRMDYSTNWTIGDIQPLEMSNYGQLWGSEQARDDAEVFYWLCFNNPVQNKMLTLIRMVQYGIDLYGARKNLGVSWVMGGGGNGQGRMLPFTFAATFLNSTEIRTELQKVVTTGVTGNTFWESEMFYHSSKNNVVLWGKADWMTEENYWYGLSTNNNDNKDGRDIAYGWIDGQSIPGEYYQGCVSLPTKYTALVLHLIPELQADWPGDHTIIMDYADRWTTLGTYTQPDPCAPGPVLTETQWTNRASSGYGTTWGPDPAHPGDCIRDLDSSNGIGRFPALHGTHRNSLDLAAGRMSYFGERMWIAYRHINDPVTKDAAGIKPSPALSLTIANNPLTDGLRPMIVEFMAPAAGITQAIIYDTRGNEIRNLDAGKGTAGLQRVVWDGKDAQGAQVPGGMYYLHLKTGDREVLTKIVTLK
jgi:hypothetical protein